MMEALSTVHECRVHYTVTTDGQGHNGCLTVRAQADFATLPGSSFPPTISLTRQWPNRESKTFEGLLFRLLYDLDFAIGEKYQQRFLPEVQ